MKIFKHINFIVMTVCECRLEFLTLHDLFPCGKAGRRGLWRPVQERLEKDPGLTCSMDLVSGGQYLLCCAHIEANVKEMVIQSVTQAAQKKKSEYSH